MRKIVLILLMSCPTISQSYDFGLSASGNTLGVDYWGDLSKENWGYYFRFVLDSDEYTDGKIVSVCSDGKISGSLGTGTCSGHGGVSNTKEAEFDRWALVIGPEYYINSRVTANVGLLAAFYSSDANIGDEGKLDFMDYGLDFGLSFRFSDKGHKVYTGYETERKQTYVGLRFPF